MIPFRCYPLEVPMLSPMRRRVRSWDILVKNTSTGQHCSQVVKPGIQSTHLCTRTPRPRVPRASQIVLRPPIRNIASSSHAEDKLETGTYWSRNNWWISTCSGSHEPVAFTHNRIRISRPRFRPLLYPSCTVNSTEISDERDGRNTIPCGQS